MMVNCDGTCIDWADSKGLNQWEHQALELAEEQSKLAHASATGSSAGR
jgi:hypothetical protein